MAVRFRIDTGSLPPDANFVTRELVEELGLETQRTAPFPFSQVCGQFDCTEMVRLEWSHGPGEQPVFTKCFVLPSSSNVTMPMLGKHFIDTSGKYLWDEEPTNLIAYTTQGKMKVTKASARLLLEAPGHIIS